MIGQHPDPPTLRRFIERQLSLEDVLDLSWHFARCEGCRDRLQRLSPRTAELMERLAPSLELEENRLMAQDYESAFDRVRRRLVAKGPTLAADVDLGAELMTELGRLTIGARRDLVATDHRFASRSLAERLLAKVRTTWGEDPNLAEDHARLALEVVQRLDPETFGRAPLNDLQSRAWAYLANVQRIRSDLRSVEESFTISEAFLAQGSGDPIARAEVLDLKASFARAQRRFDEALSLLNQVSAAYFKAGDQHMVGRTLVNKALVHGYAGHPEKSVRLLDKALGLIDAEREPRTHLSAMQQLVVYLNELGRLDDALALLPQAKRAAEKVGTRLDQVRIRWVEGLIAAEQADSTAAEAAFTEVQQAYVQEDIGYNAALVSLDLAALYLRQGRAAETRQLAIAMLPIFQSRDIHREALAALMVFRRAVDIEKATVGMVQDIAKYLKQARSNPGLRYETPS